MAYVAQWMDSVSKTIQTDIRPESGISAGAMNDKMETCRCLAVGGSCGPSWDVLIPPEPGGPVSISNS